MADIEAQKLEEMYRTLYTIRVFETQCIKLYRQGLIVGYFHPYLGEEAIATGVCAALKPDDYIVSTHRGHGHCIAKGGQLKKMVAEVLGRVDGYCKGRGGSMHIADVKTGNMGANGIVGAGMPLGVGAGLGIRLRGSGQVATVFFSDGAANNGTFAESLNLAAIWDLPVIFVLENNQFAVSTPSESSSRVADLYERGKGYGVESRKVDGNDVLEVYQNTLEAAELCRAGKGPVLICAKTYRHGGHHVNDPGTYMPQEKLDYYKAKDPVVTTAALLCSRFGYSEEQVEEIRRQIDAEMEEAVEFARNSPEPSVGDFLQEIAYQ